MEDKVYKIIKKLCDNGCNAYLTGGAVRDLFMNKEPYDYDVVTEATPDQIERFFQNVKTVGKSFEVCLVDNIEVAGYRKDTYFGLSDKNCRIEPALTLEEDLSRRDLTINSMAFCPYTGELIDPYDGMSDLKNKIIKFTGVAKDRIYEDPCRIIRACRFLTSINGKFDVKTFNALKEYSYLIKHISKERIRLELFKALKHNTSIFFQALHDINGLKYIFPSLENCFDHTGGKFHNENLFTHNMIVGDLISNQCLLTKLTGYLHDVGKPIVYDGESFINHEKIGGEIIQKELTNLKFTKKEINYIDDLIHLHMFNIGKASPKGIRKFIKKLNDANIHYTNWLRIKFADSTGNLKKGPYPFSIKKKMINSIENELFQEKNVFNITQLEINGNDIMELLNIKPGPEVGLKLKQLYEAVLEDPTLNQRKKLINLL